MRRNRPILLLVDNRSRDGDGILLIYSWLKSLGCHVALCNKRNWKLAFERYQPSVFAISTGLSLGPGAAELWRPYATRCKIVIIPQEGALPEENGRRTKEFYRGHLDGGSFTKEVTRIYMWGKQTADWVLEDGVFKPEQVLVTGTPRVDPYRLYSTLEARKRGLDPANGQTSVGFAVSHGSINAYNSNGSVLEVMYSYRHRNGRQVGLGQYYEPGGGMEDYVWMLCRILRNEFDIMDRFRQNYPDNLFIRPDPFENERGYSYVQYKIHNLTVSRSVQLYEWVQALYCLITYYSTTAIEALLSGIPVISPLKTLGLRLYDHINLGHFVNPSFLPYVWQPKDLDETLGMIEAARESKLPYSPRPKAFADFLRDFYDWPRDEPSSLSIARDLAILSEQDLLTSNMLLWRYPQRPLYRAIARTMPFGWSALMAGHALRCAVQDWRRGIFKSMQQYYFYRWHVADFRRVHNLWLAFKEKDRMKDVYN